MQSFALSWVLLFIGGYLVIYFLADFIIDNLKNLSESFSISPIVLGLLILGVDLEESIVSLVAAANGLPYLSLGNIIGNTVIAIGIAFGLPALYLKAKMNQLPRFYYIEMVVASFLVFCSMILTSYLFIFGIISLVLFVFHIIYTIRIQRAFKRSPQDIDSDEFVPDRALNANDDENNTRGSHLLIKLLIALIVLFVAAEVLVTSAEELVVLTGLNESFFGLVIMAAVTNVEEFWLIVKSIQKDQTAIGVSAQVGKIIWNTTLIYGLSSLLIFQFASQMVMILSSTILFLAVILLSVNLSQNRMSRIAGLCYLSILLIFLVFNSLFIY